MAVVVSQAAGCIITSGGGEDEYATITATWSLKQQATGQIISCPPGTTTAAIYSQPVDSANRPVGNAIIDLHDCNDNSGRTAPLPPDVYQVWIELTSQGGGTVHARSLSAIVDVIDVDKTFSTTILNDGGYFQFDWSLVDAGNNAPLRCSEVPELGGISAISTTTTTPTMSFDDMYDCVDGTAITPALVAGAYTLSVEAFDGNNRSISPVASTVSGTILDRNRVTDVGAITVRVN